MLLLLFWLSSWDQLSIWGWRPQQSHSLVPKIYRAPGESLFLSSHLKSRNTGSNNIKGVMDSTNMENQLDDPRAGWVSKRMMAILPHSYVGCYHKMPLHFWGISSYTSQNNKDNSLLTCLKSVTNWQLSHHMDLVPIPGPTPGVGIYSGKDICMCIYSFYQVFPL